MGSGRRQDRERAQWKAVLGVSVGGGGRRRDQDRQDVEIPPINCAAMENLVFNPSKF